MKSVKAGTRRAICKSLKKPPASPSTVWFWKFGPGRVRARATAPFRCSIHEASNMPRRHTMPSRT